MAIATAWQQHHQDATAVAFAASNANICNFKHQYLKSINRLIAAVAAKEMEDNAQQFLAVIAK